MAVLKASCHFSAVPSSGAVTHVIVRVDGRVTVSSSGQLIIGYPSKRVLELHWWQQKGSTQEPLCVSIMSHSQDSPQVLYEAPTWAYLLLPTVYFLSAQWLHHTDYSLLIVYVQGCSTRPWWCAVSVSFKAARFNHKCCWTIKWLNDWFQC